MMLKWKFGDGNHRTAIDGFGQYSIANYSAVYIFVGWEWTSIAIGQEKT